MKTYSQVSFFQVRVSMYKSDAEVAWVEFDGANSTKTDFFTPSRVLDSSYNDLTPGANYQYFSLEG